MTTTEPAHMRDARIYRRNAFDRGLDAIGVLKNSFRTLYMNVEPFADVPLYDLLGVTDQLLNTIEGLVDAGYRGALEPATVEATSA